MYHTLGMHLNLPAQKHTVITIRVAATTVSLVLFVLVAHVQSARPLLLLFINDAVMKNL